MHPGGQSCSSTPHGAGMVVKLCDFGLARYLPSKRSTTAAARPRRGGEAGPLDDRKQRLGGLTDYVVTRWYRAPEVRHSRPGTCTCVIHTRACFTRQHGSSAAVPVHSGVRM